MISGTTMGNAGRSAAVPERSLRLAGSLIKGRYRVDAVSSVSRDMVVYAAEDIRYRRPVTVKILRGEVAADAEFVAAARTQAGTLAMFTHAHRGVARVYECDVTDTGELFVALERTEGATLREVLDGRGALDPLTALRVASRVGEALEALHLNRIIHGQLGPDSVLMATHDDGTEHVTLVGVELSAAYRTPIGLRLRDAPSLAYRAPEQAERGETTEATDVYALGMLLRELLTADRPQETMGAGTAAPVLVPAVERIIATALDARPEQRYPDISVMVNDMWGAQTVLAESESHARSVKPPAQTVLAEAESNVRSMKPPAQTVLAKPESHARSVKPPAQTVLAGPASRARSSKSRANLHRRARPRRLRVTLRISAAVVIAGIIAVVLWGAPSDRVFSRSRAPVTTPALTVIPVDKGVTPPPVHPLSTEPPRAPSSASTVREQMSTRPESHAAKDASTVEGLAFPATKPPPAPAVVRQEPVAAPVVDPRPFESRDPTERPTRMERPGPDGGDGSAIIDWLLKKRR